MKNTEFINICKSACEELEVFISFTRQLLEKSSRDQSRAMLNSYIVKIYEISNSKALPQFISLFEKHSDDLNTEANKRCQYAIKQLNIFYTQILPRHLSELSKLSESNLSPKDQLIGFIRSTEIIKKNLMQDY